jgi:hypothetical protein
VTTPVVALSIGFPASPRHRRLPGREAAGRKIALARTTHLTNLETIASLHRRALALGAIVSRDEPT